jgi:tetratricopeptide (TPR) repeat protein
MRSLFQGRTRAIRRPRLIPSLLSCLGLGLCIAAPLHADRLVTKDGRVVEAKKVRENGETYEITFKAGQVVCKKTDVASAEIIEDVSEYVPKNDEEKKKLDAGFVRMNGKWMTKGALQAELDKRAKEAQKRTADRALHSDFYQGWTKETSHFKFQTNTSPELLDFYSNLLEAYYSLLDSRIGIKPTPTLRATKMKVNIYRSRQDFSDNNEVGAGGSVVGYFSFPNQTLNFFHDYTDPESSQQTALHECTHLLTYLIDPQFLSPVYSIWVNEGMAEYLGTAKVTQDPKSKKITIEPGQMLLDATLTVQEAIKSGTDIKLKDLFLIQKPGFQYPAYAHSWSFIYFLHSKEATRKNFTSFFRDLYTRTGVESEMDGNFAVVPTAEVQRLLFSKLKIKDLDALDKEWKAYIASIPVDGPEARFRRGQIYLLVGWGEEEQARKDFNAAIEGGILHPDAFAGRAELSMRNGDREKAISDYRRALELDPLNPEYYYELAQAISRASFFVNTGPVNMTIKGISTKTRLDDSLTIAEVDDGEKYLGLAAELDPESDDKAKVLEKYRKAKERWLARKAKGAAAADESEAEAPTAGDSEPKSGDGASKPGDKQ